VPAVPDRLGRNPDSIHIAEPREVAAIIAFPSSEEARLITGNVIRLH
jgi:hypothetical protein